MARKPLNKANSYEFLLEGNPGSTKLTKLFPTDDGGIAISWAAGVLMLKTGDNRPGDPVPEGDYLLSLVGPLATEPMFRMRKYDGVVSWEAA